MMKNDERFIVAKKDENTEKEHDLNQMPPCLADGEGKEGRYLI